MVGRNFDMKNRKASRRVTRIAGRVRYYDQAASGRVVNLSTAGLALDLNGPFCASAGSPVKIESEELGILEGTVKWSHRGRLGIEFNPNSNATAQVASYFRFFHKNIEPVLRR